jgi:uncharacterized protein YutD
MSIIAEKQIEHLGESKAAADHDHDMVHDLSRRLDAFWRYDQYIANSESNPELKKFWKDVKNQDDKNISRLKQLLAQHCSRGCF